MNLTTGVVTTTVSNTIYTDKQLAVYQVDKVLLPLAMFGAPPSLAPAPSEPGKDVPNSPSSLPKSSGGSSPDTSVAVAPARRGRAVASQVTAGAAVLAATLLAL